MGATATSDITSNITNIIWIEPNVDNEENKYYLKELKNIKNTKISCFKNVMDSLALIKKIKFSETNIILNISLYTEFIEKFEENITDIFIIPTIIILTSNKERFIDNNKNYKDKYYSFYNLGGIQTSFDDIINLLLKQLSKPTNKNDKIEEKWINFWIYRL